MLFKIADYRKPLQVSALKIKHSNNTPVVTKAKTNINKTRVTNESRLLTAPLFRLKRNMSNESKTNSPISTAVNDLLEARTLRMHARYLEHTTGYQ